MKQVPPTFGEIAMKLLDQMAAKKNFIFSTDCYEDDSPKNQMRQLRGMSEKLLVSKAAQRRPLEWKSFLMNHENKLRLFQLIKEVWATSGANRLERCQLAITVVKGDAFKFTVQHGGVLVEHLHELSSNQEETDTRVVLYLKYIEAMGYPVAVVRTPYTDIFMILLHYVASFSTITVFIDLGVGESRKVINVTAVAGVYGQDYCTALLGLHIFTGKDTTSAFKGKGKKGPLKILQSNPRYQNTFKMLGEDWTVSEALYQELEAFVCLMYGYPRLRDINMVRGRPSSSGWLGQPAC